jgi:hypothetical protein
VKLRISWFTSSRATSRARASVPGLSAYEQRPAAAGRTTIVTATRA